MWPQTEPLPTISQALISWPLAFTLYNSWSLANPQSLTSFYLTHHPSPWISYVDITLPSITRLWWTPTISKKITCHLFLSKCSQGLVALAYSFVTFASVILTWRSSVPPLHWCTETIRWHLAALSLGANPSFPGASFWKDTRNLCQAGFNAGHPHLASSRWKIHST